MALRKGLWARGKRYRLHVKNLPGRPDLAFASRRLVVFVDGDFWHGNQWRKRGFCSLEAQFEGVTNAQYWVPKISRNVQRDEVNTRSLERSGWRVLRIWESEIKTDLSSCVERVCEALDSEEERS